MPVQLDQINILYYLYLQPIYAQSSTALLKHGEYGWGVGVVLLLGGTDSVRTRITVSFEADGNSSPAHQPDTSRRCPVDAVKAFGGGGGPFSCRSRVLCPAAVTIAE